MEEVSFGQLNSWSALHLDGGRVSCRVAEGMDSLMERGQAAARVRLAYHSSQGAKLLDSLGLDLLPPVDSHEEGKYWAVEG